ncbi:MAG: T9SS type A sorting domain-containing protein [candidate division WOR-3 bacterium]|nr:T9SS type A sorting domain-containing protein [candidate division WOR-3 bacterium]
MYRSRITFALAMAALAAILVPSSLTAQTTFQRTYGGTESDQGYSVQQTDDNGYIIVGYTTSYGAGGADVYLIKTDAGGNTLWTRTYGDTAHDEGWSVQQTTDGGYIIAGYTLSFGAGDHDVYLIKTDAGGDTQWTRTCGGTGLDAGWSVQQTTDSGYVITGATTSSGAGTEDVYLIKTDAQGNSLWTRTFGSSDIEEGHSVQQTADGGYVIAGWTCSFGAGGADMYLVKTNANGDTLWTRTFGGADEGHSVQQTTDGGYIIAGYTTSFSGGVCDVYLVKTDSDGDTIWTRTYGGADDDVGLSVQQTADDGFIVAGLTYSFGEGHCDAYLIKTDSNGDTLWTRTFGGTSFDIGFSVQQTADGGYVLAGYTGSFGAGGNDVYLVKTDSLGVIAAVAEPKASPPRAPALSLSCTPNPASGSVTISLSPFIPLSLSPVLRIYDSQGRMVLSRPVSTSSFPISTSDLPSGAYFVRCDFAGQHATARLVLQH